MEMSKKLTWVILSFYFLIILLTIFLNLFGNDVKFILDYLQPLAITVIVSYFGKSGYENKFKINNNGSSGI